MDSYGSHSVVLLDSGTSALALAIRIAFSQRPGRPCLLPAYGCFDLATAVIGEGVPVRFYDVDPASLQPCIESIVGLLGHNPSSLVVVHHYGVPVDIEPISALAHRAGVLLIEDAAQAVGGRLHGRPLGATGDFGVLSFGRGKGLTAGGGGALLIRAAFSAEGDELLPQPSNSRLLTSVKLGLQSLFSSPLLYGIPSAIPALGLGETRFRPPSALMAMSSANARVLHHTLREAGAETKARTVNAEKLISAAGRSTAFQIPPIVDGGVAGWLRFPVIPQLLVEIPKTLLRLGVRRGYPVPLSKLKELSALSLSVDHCPGAQALSDRLITLPCHSLVSGSDIKELQRWLSEAAPA